jgi:hypothetical protein
MNKPSSGSWWSSLGFGKRAAAKDSDYADMGTAFGLDASMDTRPGPDDAGGPETDSGRPPNDSLGRGAKR